MTRGTPSGVMPFLSQNQPILNNIQRANQGIIGKGHRWVLRQEDISIHLFFYSYAFLELQKVPHSGLDTGKRLDTSFIVNTRGSIAKLLKYICQW